MNARAFSAYAQTVIDTTPNGVAILLKVYDYILLNINKAIANFDIPDSRTESLVRMNTAIGVLRSRLNYDETCKEISQALDSLYEFTGRYALEGTLNRNVKNLYDVRKIIETLKEGWVELKKRNG